MMTASHSVKLFFDGLKGQQKDILESESLTSLAAGGMDWLSMQSSIETGKKRVKTPFDTSFRQPLFSFLCLFIGFGRKISFFLSIPS